MRQRLRALPPAEVRVCAVVKFESLPFDDAAAEVYGRLRAELTHRDTPIGPNDLMIAAIALAHDFTWSPTTPPNSPA